MFCAELFYKEGRFKMVSFSINNKIEIDDLILLQMYSLRIGKNQTKIDRRFNECLSRIFLDIVIYKKYESKVIKDKLDFLINTYQKYEDIEKNKNEINIITEDESKFYAGYKENALIDSNGIETDERIQSLDMLSLKDEFLLIEEGVDIFHILVKAVETRTYYDKFVNRLIKIMTKYHIEELIREVLSSPKLLHKIRKELRG